MFVTTPNSFLKLGVFFFTVGNPFLNPPIAHQSCKLG